MKMKRTFRRPKPSRTVEWKSGVDTVRYCSVHENISSKLQTMRACVDNP